MNTTGTRSMRHGGARLLSVLAVTAALLLAPMASQPASASVSTTHGAQVSTEVGCWSYGNPRHLAMLISVSRETAYSSQWVAYRIWMYSYAVGSWVPGPWTTAVADIYQPATKVLNVPLSTLSPTYYRVATEAKWYRPTGWTNSVFDNAARYTQFTLGRVPVDYSASCYA